MIEKKQKTANLAIINSNYMVQNYDKMIEK